MAWLSKSLPHWIAAQRRRTEARALLEAGPRTFADLGVRRGDLERALHAPALESALDVAYRDSARLRATYALH